MPRTRKFGIYELKQWLITIKKAGFETYYHNQLPEHLQNQAMQVAAIKRGVLRKTGNVNRYGGRFVHEYQIPPGIENIRINKPTPW